MREAIPERELKTIDCSLRPFSGLPVLVHLGVIYPRPLAAGVMFINGFPVGSRMELGNVSGRPFPMIPILKSC